MTCEFQFNTPHPINSYLHLLPAWEIKFTKNLGLNMATAGKYFRSTQNVTFPHQTKTVSNAVTTQLYKHSIFKLTQHI